MGRGNKRGRGGNKRIGGGRGGSSAEPRVAGRDQDKWLPASFENAKFEAYYKAQLIIPDEEWTAFMASLHEPLPTTFRITGCREIADSLNELIKNTYVPFLSGLEHEGALLSPPKSLEWYPNGYAWQLNIAKQHIRKNEAFRKFQNFLVYETDAGNISRQEAVSMIPPLLLDVQPHHNVLDVCAAPGSKSVQLLEALHAIPDPSTLSTGPDAPLGRIPAGLLIANDSDAKRCHMLVHQSLHRIPAAGMMVTNHDACQLPGLRLPIDTPSANMLVADGSDTVEPQKWKSLLFDRILADVPCSGDGTLRKNVGIWNEWTLGNGTGLHGLQLRILMRAISLLKPGGRLVYSTCSLNPIENEAVVSAALAASSDMSLVAVPEMLPALVRRPGLTTWRVMDNAMSDAMHPSEFPPVSRDGEEEKRRRKWTPTLWPNGMEAERGLDRCLRIYPHLQDTGGFFVAVLVKAETVVAVAETVAEVEIVAVASTSDISKRTIDDRASSPVQGEPSAKRVRQEDNTVDDTIVEKVEAPVAVEVDVSKLPAEIVGTLAKTTEFKEEPFIYLSPEDEQVKTCIDFFDLDPSFPVSSLLVRNASGVALRSIYFTSPIVRSLLLSNTYNRMRLISCGVKVFTRQDSGRDGTYRCKWRVVSEGLEIIRPYMGPKRILQASVATLRVLMGELNVPFADLTESGFMERLDALEPGSCVLEVTAAGDGVHLEQQLVLPLWRSKSSASLMVEKVEKSALSLRIFGEDLTPNKVTKARDAAKTETEESTPVAEGEAAVVSEAVEGAVAETKVAEVATL